MIESNIQIDETEPVKTPAPTPTETVVAGTGDTGATPETDSTKGQTPTPTPTPTITTNTTTTGTTVSQVSTFAYRFPTASVTYIKQGGIKREIVPITFSNTGRENISVGLSSSKDWISIVDQETWEDIRLPDKGLTLFPNTIKKFAVSLDYPTSYETETIGTKNEFLKITPIVGTLTPQELNQIVQEGTNPSPSIAIKWRNVNFNTVISNEVSNTSTVKQYPRYPVAFEFGGQSFSDDFSKLSFGSSFTPLNENEITFKVKTLEDTIRKLDIILANFSKPESAYSTPGNGRDMRNHTWNFPIEDFPNAGEYVQTQNRATKAPEWLWVRGASTTLGLGTNPGESREGGAVRLMKFALADALFCQNGVCKLYPDNYKYYRFSDRDVIDSGFDATLKYIRAILNEYKETIQIAIKAEDSSYSRLLDTSKPITITQPLKIDISTLQIPLDDAILSASSDVLAKKMLTYFDSDREYKTLLNFGEDKQYLTTAWRFSPSNPSTVQFKLLNPLGDFGLYDAAYVSRELAKSVVDTVEFDVAPERDTTPYLRPKNTLVSKYLPQSSKLQDQTLETLGLYTGSAGALVDGKITYEDLVFRRWFTADFNESELNIDFTDYNNFVTYGSAYHRLLSFYNKLTSIEDLDSRINGSGAGDAVLARQKEDIIRNFDAYEEYLYFSTDISPYSASNAYREPETEYNVIATWPKDINGKPYKTTTTTATTWFYNQGVIAQRYDENNQNYLIKHLPQHVREDEQSGEFLLFVSMIGHVMDNLKSYVDKLPDIYSAEISPYEGLTVDQVYEVAKSFGLELPNIFSLQKLQSFVSAITGESPARDIAAEIWKRFLHILVHLSKIKGTRTSLDTVLNAYGISSPVVQIKETAYSSEDNYIKSDELTYGLEFSSTANNFIRVPLVSASIATSTVQLRFIPELRQSASVLTGDADKWSIDIIPHPSQSKLDYGRIHVVTGPSRTLVATSSYFKLFEDDYTNIMIRSQSTDLTIIQTDGDQILFQETIQTAIPTSTWNNTTYVYIGGSGSLRLNNFDGVVDEFRGWGENIDIVTFVKQAYDPGSYYGTYFTSSYAHLYSLLTFNEPLTSVTQSLPNESPYKNISLIPEFKLNDFTLNSYSRVLRTIKQDSPLIGTTVYTNNKVKVAAPPVFNSSFVDGDGSYLLNRQNSIKAIEDKKYTGGKNVVSFAVSPSDYINNSIARTMGLIDVNSIIGSPRKFTNENYTELDELYDYYIQNYIKTGSIQYINFNNDSVWADGNQSINNGTGWQFLVGRKPTTELNATDGVTQAFTGLPTYAAKIATRTSLHSTNWQFDTIPVNAGEVYNISGYAYANGTTWEGLQGNPDSAIGYIIQLLDSSNNTLGYNFAISPSGPVGWQFVQTQITIGAGTSSISVGPFIDGPYPYGFGYGSPVCTEAQAELGCPGYAWFSALKVERTSPIAGTYLANNVVNSNEYIRFFRNLLQGPTEFAENIVPARTKLQKGVVIESPILKRNKTYKLRYVSVDGANTHKFDKFIAGSGSAGIGAYNFDVMYEKVVMTPTTTSDTEDIDTSIVMTDSIRPVSSTDFSKIPPQRYTPQYVDGYLLTSSILDDRSAFLSIEAPSIDAGVSEELAPGYPRDPYLGIEGRLDSEEDTFTPYYDIPPRSDFNDVGTWQYFHKETGIYYFDIYTISKEPYVVRYDSKAESPVSQKYAPLTLVRTGSLSLLPGRRASELPIREYPANSYTTGTVRIANIASLLGLSAAAGLRIRLYNTEYERIADQNRAFTSSFGLNSGVLFDALIENDTDVYPYTLVESENDGILYYSIDNTTAAPISTPIDFYYFVFQPETLIPAGYLPRHYRFSRDNRLGLKRRNYLGTQYTDENVPPGCPWDPCPPFRSDSATEYQRPVKQKGRLGVK